MSNAPEPHHKSEVGRGFSFAIAAYMMWGLVPIYWQALKPADATEILASRMLWSFVFLAPIVLWQRKLPAIRDVLRNTRQRNLLLLASVFIGANWWIFIWATTNGHILDSSLGYFTIPLFSTALGVIFLKERLRPLQWTALAVAGIALIYITWEKHTFPWIGLSLAGTFAIYGLIKKLAGVEALESLTIETVYLLPIAAGYLGYLSSQQLNTFGTHGIPHALFMMGTGVATAVPLLLYGAAVIRVPLFYIGFLQYIASTMQFFVGIYIFHEEMDTKRFLGFAITWVALVLLATDNIRQRRTPASQVVELD